MSHESLEQQIVEALRRAPGPEPGAALDAAILARARAAVAQTPRRRPETRWLSLAAGVLVIVGGGLALRIWQQVEHLPGPLDAPPAAIAPVPEDAVTTSNAAKADLGRGAPDTALRKEEAPAELADRLGEDAPAATSASAGLDANLGQLRADADAEARAKAPAPAQTETAEALKIAPAAPALALPARRDLAEEQRERTASVDDERISQKLAEPAAGAPPASAADAAPAVMPAEPPAAPKPLAAPAPAPSPPPPAGLAPAPPASAPFPGLSGAAAERQSAPLPEGRAQALQPVPGEVSERYARIRSLLAAQQTAAALDELRALLREYPELPLPPDLQAALQQLESGS